nr:MAG TPA: hypothetical protein [Caudoviricetes sp.]
MIFLISSWTVSVVYTGCTHLFCFHFCSIPLLSVLKYKSSQDIHFDA